MATFIIKELCEDYEDIKEIYRCNEEPSKEEMEKICIDYIQYYWLDKYDRVDFEVVDIERCGWGNSRIIITFNSKKLENDKDGWKFDYQGVRLTFIGEYEKEFKLGWLVDLDKNGKV